MTGKTLCYVIETPSVSKETAICSCALELRESLLRFPVNMFVLHLAALFHGLTLFLKAVPKTEGDVVMLCLHESLFGFIKF